MGYKPLRPQPLWDHCGLLDISYFCVVSCFVSLWLLFAVPCLDTVGFLGRKLIKHTHATACLLEAKCHKGVKENTRISRQGNKRKHEKKKVTKEQTTQTSLVQSSTRRVQSGMVAKGAGCKVARTGCSLHRRPGTNCTISLSIN